MTILVALPYWNAEAYIERAVRSVLEQTERDLVLLVVGDGDEPPVARIRDDRLLVHTFPVNHGPPFVQQAMLLASPFERYAPFGSDDWADPDHLGFLASYGEPNVCAGAVWWHVDPEPAPHHVRTANYEVGLYRTADLRRIGGYGAQERLGQDNLMLQILTRTLGLRASERPTYHRVRRPGSLTTVPETGLRSPLRETIRRRNWAVMYHCQRMRWEVDRIRAYRESLVPSALRAELLDRAGALERLLRERGEAAAA